MRLSTLLEKHKGFFSFKKHRKYLQKTRRGQSRNEQRVETKTNVVAIVIVVAVWLVVLVLPESLDSVPALFLVKA